MLTAVVALAIAQARPSPAAQVWQRVIANYRQVKTYRGGTTVYRIVNGKRTKIGDSFLSINPDGSVDFRYRDDEEGLTCTLTRDGKGNWQGGTSEDRPSQSTANNALGYADSIPSSWSYLPVKLVLKGEDEPEFDATGDVKRTTVGSEAWLGITDGGDQTIWVEEMSLRLRKITAKLGPREEKQTYFWLPRR